MLNKDTKFTEALRKYRLQNRLSFYDLERKTGISHETIRKILAGRDPRETTVYAIESNIPDLYKCEVA